MLAGVVLLSTVGCARVPPQNIYIDRVDYGLVIAES